MSAEFWAEASNLPSVDASVASFADKLAAVSVGATATASVHVLVEALVPESEEVTVLDHKRRLVLGLDWRSVEAPVSTLVASTVEVTNKQPGMH